MSEKCQNPLKPKCKRKDIALTIRVRNRMLPICKECWRMLAKADAEWGEKGFRIRTKVKRSGRIRSKHSKK